VSVYERFLRRLPVRRFGHRADVHELDPEAAGHIRRVERLLVTAAAGLAVVGFLAYYVPVYRAPELFPAVTVTVPVLGSVRLPWGEFLWAVLLTTVELTLLTLLNIIGVHEIAVATGVVRPRPSRTRPRRSCRSVSSGRAPRLPATASIRSRGFDPGCCSCST
jgi:hypothetical protein